MNGAYRAVDVPVRGGELRVGTWRSADAGEQPPRDVVLALHGITSSHQAWALVAAELTRAPGVLVLAPDLRGRGRSAQLPGPWGMDQHAADAAAVLDHLAPQARAVLAGHSMGGFVAVTLAARRPELTAGALLVDGGIPLTLPEGATLDATARATLGPAAERLSMTFPDRASYQQFWRAHPALGEEFSPAVAAYVDYDLVPDGPPWRSGCRPEAVSADFADQFAGGLVDRLWPEVACPVLFLRAPRGLQNEPGGLYSRPAIDRWQDEHPGFAQREIADVNHYTIVLGQRGAGTVAGAVAELFPGHS